MISPQTVDQIKTALNRTTCILVLGHSNPRPDGDSLGSVLAMAEYCRALKKLALTYCQYPAESSLEFLPDVNSIINDPAKIAGQKFDLVICLDFGELQQSGAETELLALKKLGLTFINIDHHFSNPETLGNISLVVKDASSTSEIIYYLLKSLNAEITKDMATCLLTGILTDTQHFTNGATTFTAMRAAAELLKFGARLQEITHYTWQNKELPTLRLWGKVLLRLQHDPQTGVATTAIMLKDLEEENLSAEAAEGVSNFLNSLGEAKAIMVLREEVGGQVKGSLRTTRDDVDVLAIAKKFGGGGHQKAAGFTIPGHIVKTDQGWMVVE